MMNRIIVLLLALSCGSAFQAPLRLINVRTVRPSKPLHGGKAGASESGDYLSRLNRPKLVTPKGKKEALGTSSYLEKISDDSIFKSIKKTFAVANWWGRYRQSVALSSKVALFYLVLNNALGYLAYTLLFEIEEFVVTTPLIVFWILLNMEFGRFVPKQYRDKLAGNVGQKNRQVASAIVLVVFNIAGSLGLLKLGLALFPGFFYPETVSKGRRYASRRYASSRRW